MNRIPVVQKHEYGCGAACVSFVCGMKYNKVLQLLGIKKAENTGFICKELVNFLTKNGYLCIYKYLNKKQYKKIYKDLTIVFLRRSKKYPSGHYVVRHKNVWMDPWINYQKGEGIINAKSGYRKRLPERPIYAILFREQVLL